MVLYPPPHPLSIPPRGGGVTWPTNNEKSTGNHRRQRRRRKILIGYTRIQVNCCVVSVPLGVGGNRHLVTAPPEGVGGGTVVPFGGGMDMGGRGTPARRSELPRIAAYAYGDVQVWSAL